MSYWDKTVGREIETLSGSIPIVVVGKISLGCSRRAVLYCIASTCRLLTEEQRKYASFLDGILIECDREPLRTIDIFDPHFAVLESLACDPLREDLANQSWFLCMDAIFSTVLLFKEPHNWLSHFATALDAAYRAVVEVDVQRAIGRQGRVADERELIQIERSLPSCQAEIDFQLAQLSDIDID